ncbi:thiol:disulfide interchange protein DsbA [Aurantivibrio infirmus]
MRKIFQQCVIAIALSVLTFTSFAAGPYVEGTDYIVFENPVRTTNPKKIEVAEPFAYDCPACYALSGVIEPWKKNLPEDVVFVDLPVGFKNPNKINLARAYYTAKALGKLDELHPQIFNTIHVQRKPLFNEKQIGDLFVLNGVDKEVFTKTFNSPGIQNFIAQSDVRIGKYLVEGTPEIIIGGQYKIHYMGNDLPRMLEVADYLIEKIRSERSGE